MLVDWPGLVVLTHGCWLVPHLTAHKWLAANPVYSSATLCEPHSLGLRLLDVPGSVPVCAPTGPLPISWTLLPWLTMVDASNNELSGTLPWQLAFQSKLSILALHGNAALSGSISPWWRCGQADVVCHSFRATHAYAHQCSQL